MAKPSVLPADRSVAPEASVGAQKLKSALMAPIERFLHIQAASGLILLGCAVVALAWANSPWHQSYHDLWHTSLGLELGVLRFEQSLHFWINDGLMTIFFFVVGLEIKREIMEGELSELKRAALPIGAALGGMLVPAAIYFGFNQSGEQARGWGVPMATDIAFAVGILSLLGNRVPAALRILLLALAIIDDIGAIIVIAVFYSGGLQWDGLLVVLGGFGIVLLFQRLNIRQATAYLLPGTIIWGGMLRLGVHPTIAGVLLGLVTPHKSWFGKEGFLLEAKQALEDFQLKMTSPAKDDHALTEPLDRIAVARREAFSPAVRLEQALHGHVAYLIMPVFALANAGVHVGELDLDLAGATTTGLGVALGLMLGKPIGILAASFLSVKLGLAELPRGVDYKGVFIVGCVGGVGFTMAIFIAELAFRGNALLGVAKLAVLVGSTLIALIGLALGKLLLPKELPKDIADISVHDAERSTEF